MKGQMMITKTTQKVLDKELARMRLREIFEDQSRPTIYTILRHVSASGMSRDISAFTIDKSGEKINLTYTISEALSEKCRISNGFNAIRVQGCGMDMGFSLVYSVICEIYKADGDFNSSRIHHEWA